MTDSDVKRATRVAERIREELTELLSRGGIRDPRAEGALVSGVLVSDDLRNAKVYVRRLVPGASEGEQKTLVDALTRASGFIRREIGEHLGMRHVPEIRFYWDDGVDHALRMEEVFADLKREREGQGEGGAS